MTQTRADETAPSSVDLTPKSQASVSVTRRAVHEGERFGLLILLIAVYAFFAILPASSAAYASSANFQAILGNIAVVSILAIAAIFPLIGGHFDFSVGATALVSSITCAAVMSNHDGGLALAIPAALLAGLCVGMVNAVLVAVLDLNAFIVTIGMATLLPGVVQWYTGGLDLITNIDERLRNFGSLQFLGAPRTLWLLLGVVLVTWFALSQTAWGRKLYAVGQNPVAAKLVGINVKRMVFVSFLVSGLLSGLAGVVLTARNGGGLTNSGADLLFPALAAVFLGATVIEPGRYNVVGSVIGVLFVAVSVSGLTIAGAANWVPAVFNGAALIVAVALSSALARKRGAQRSGS